MEREMLERFPGIGCAHIDAAGNVSSEYSGFADRESRVPVDAGTIFPACSISKFVTAVCLMILHERKVIDIEAPVNDHLRGWKFLSADGTGSRASARSLMSHTAGVSDGEDSFYGLRRGGPEVGLMDILEGRTAYNDRPVREERPEGTAFDYSDAGYCVLQQLIRDATETEFEDAARELLFDRLRLESTFFASPANMACFEAKGKMATGYDSGGARIPGRFPPVPDLAASGLWSTPAEIASIAREFAGALGGRSAILSQSSARKIAEPVEKFPWTGLGIFIEGEDMLVSRGWGENGQCILKINRRTEEIAVVMTNRDPGADQAESGIERLADSMMNGGGTE